MQQNHGHNLQTMPFDVFLRGWKQMRFITTLGSDACHRATDVASALSRSTYDVCY